MSETNHIYVGNGLYVIRDGREPYFRVQVDLTKIKHEAMSHTRKVQFNDGEHVLINLILAPMKTENQNQYKSHSLKVDTWKPDPNYRKPELSTPPAPVVNKQDDSEDFAF